MSTADKAKNIALNEMSDIAANIEKSIHREIAQRGIAEKLANNQHLDEQEKRFLENINALTFEAKKVLEWETEDIRELKSALLRVTELKKKEEPTAMKKIEGGLKGMHDDLTDLIRAIENEDGDIDRLLLRLESHQDTVFDGLEQMIELDKKLANELDVSNLLLRQAKHSGEAFSFLSRFRNLYYQRVGNSKVDEDGYTMERRSAIEQFAQSSQRQGFADEVKSKLQLPGQSPRVLENIEENLSNALGRSDFKYLGDQIEQLLEQEQSMDSGVRTEVHELIKEDSELEKKISEITQQRRRISDKNAQRLKNITKALDLSRNVLQTINRFDEDELSSEKATEELLEGRISSKNFEEVINSHIRNERKYGLERYERQMEELRASWKQNNITRR